MSRAAKETLVKKTPIIYSDFLTNLQKHPLSSDLARVTNAESIKQSMKNLIMLNYGEKPFQPNIGSNVYKSLFDPIDGFTINNLNQYITDTINFHEKRVKLLDVKVVASDSSPDEVNATISFFIINTGETTFLNLILKRVR